MSKEILSDKIISEASFPKVSIVIPVYNGSNYMKEAIDSALAQTYKNIEVIVVNDGSKDNTEEIALSYGDKIRYFKKENGGVSTVLNLAIKEMKGEYFSWLSHDDCYMPNKIQKQIDFLKEKNDDKVIPYSNYKFIDENSNPLYQPVYHNHEMLERKPIYALYRGCINGNSLLINKKIFDECGLFDENLRCIQDYDLWFKMIKKGYIFAHMNDVLVITRLHSKQVTNSNPKVITEGNEFWTNIVKDLSKEEKIKLEGSEYNFYDEMASFLAETPYDETKQYCLDQRQQVFLQMKDKITEITKSTKVSVIIPFFNRVEKLKFALETVLKQTHSNIEIILVNDCSTDDLSSIKEQIKGNTNIIFIDLEKNAGPAHARNIGIESASGEYIAFLDSDDSFLIDKIEKQLFDMLLRGSNVSHTSYLRKDNNKGVIREEIINSGLYKGVVIPRFIFSCPIATPTVMIKKDFLVPSGIRFNDKIRIGEDTCFWLDIFKTEQLTGIPESLTIVNTNSDSAAYNCEKSMLGIKNILTYLLNDEKYKNYDREIALLSTLYIEYVDELHEKNKNDESQLCPNCIKLMTSPSWVYTKPLRFIMKVVRVIKSKGILYLIRRIFKKGSN